MPADRRLLASLSVSYDGMRLSAVPGETIAATLIAHGILAQGPGRDGALRGLYCGMGVCHECLVAVDGRASQRACLTKVADGQRVFPQGSGVFRLADAAVEAPLSAGPLRERTTDVLVVGAGPGGLRGALAAASAGATVLVVDERPAPGGQYFKQAATPAAPRPDAQMRAGADLVAAIRAAGVEIVPETLACSVERDGDGGLAVVTVTHGVATIVRPRILFIATGAYEVPLQVPGWTLPGVMTPGAAQTLLRSYGVLPGRRVLVAGNGPLNIQVARELISAGVRELTLVETAPAPWRRPLEGAALLAADPALALSGLADLARLRRAGARLLFAHRLVSVEGEAGVRAAVAAPVAGGDAARVAVDAVLASDGFAPACDLARLLGLDVEIDAQGRLGIARADDGATAAPDVFVIGEAGGFGGAHIAGAMGELAGRAAARRLGFAPPGADAGARRALARHRRFQSRLRALFRAEPAPLSPDTQDEGSGTSRPSSDVMICRCEGRTASELAAAISRHEVRDVATLKRLTRAGMGRCQGRYCAELLRRLVGAPAGEASLPAPQAPVRPVPLAALAAEKDEWGGHRRVPLPDTAVPPELSLPMGEAGIVVIGAGITGLSTALFLAREGEDVVVLDRAPVNSGASGSNAGSLHAQLLSFDHGTKAEAGGGPAARTLPLQLASIDLWRELERDLGLDFEIAITGGLMVAETEENLRFLAAKTAVERAQGVVCEVIDRAELRRLEPALDPRFAGAAFCPQEGKINPLVATFGIAAAAKAAGARIVAGVEVTAIERGATGFEIATSGGILRAARVVNCAGGFASRIGGMLGLSVPVHGAPLQMIVTEATAPLVSRLVAHADRHLTLKQAANGNFIIGGGWTATLDPVHRRPRPLQASIEGNLWVARHVVPDLARLHVLRSWAAMNVNIDGAPILGEHPDAPGFFNCVTSNGYTLGPLMGQITAALVRGRDPGCDVAFFSVARFG